MALQLCVVVDSILAAFSNGMDISRRLGVRKKKKNSKVVEVDKEELQLRDSLLKGPEEIRKEYEHSVLRHGPPFEIGDPQSHSSLAHTLLVMNSGLIEIISQALSGSSKAKAMSRKSLLNLSETAAADTMSAFAQLNDRLTVSSQRRPVAILPHPAKQARHDRSRCKSDIPSPEERPAPSPLLARGGWVRSKSGSSVVSASSARRKAARKEYHKRSGSTPMASTDTVLKPALEDKQRSPKHIAVPEYLPNHTPQSLWSSKLLASEVKVEPPPYNRERPPSMLIVPADYFETFNLDLRRTPPPRPPKIPLHLRAISTSKARPLSGATFMTASTKIGEIPEDRLPGRVLSAEEREQIPLPYVIPPPLLEEPRKKRRGFRLWKKQALISC